MYIHTIYTMLHFLSMVTILVKHFSEYFHYRKNMIINGYEKKHFGYFR